MNPELYNFVNLRATCPMNSYFMGNEPAVYNANAGFNKQLMPLNNMTSELHMYIHTKVVVCMNRLATKNMGKLPVAISVDEFKNILNEILADLTKEEEKIMMMLQSRCSKVEETRGRCMYCHGMLKTMVEVMLISSLLSNGCMYCY